MRSWSTSTYAVSDLEVGNVKIDESRFVIASGGLVVRAIWRGANHRYLLYQRRGDAKITLEHVRKALPRAEIVEIGGSAKPTVKLPPKRDLKAIEERKKRREADRRANVERQDKLLAWLRTQPSSSIGFATGTIAATARDENRYLYIIDKTSAIQVLRGDLLVLRNSGHVKAVGNARWELLT